MGSFDKIGRYKASLRYQRGHCSVCVLVVFSLIPKHREDKQSTEFFKYTGKWH